MFATFITLEYAKSVDPDLAAILYYSLNIGILLNTIELACFWLPRKPNYPLNSFEGWQRSYNDNPPETGFTVIGTSWLVGLSMRDWMESELRDFLFVDFEGWQGRYQNNSSEIGFTMRDTSIDSNHMLWLIKEWAERNRVFHNQIRQHISDCHFRR